MMLYRANPEEWNALSQELLGIAKGLDPPSGRLLPCRRRALARRLHEIAQAIEEQWEMDELAADADLLETVGGND